jgi:hypothetical protein
MDTATKRGSAIHIGSPWRGVLPLPDATIDGGDRQAVAFLYSGILAESPPAETHASRLLRYIELPPRTLRATVNTRSDHGAVFTFRFIPVD